MKSGQYCLKRMVGGHVSDVAGKTALVTGGASGIGLATVELLARRGVRVALNHLPDDARGAVAVERLKAEGLAVIGAPGDVSKPGDAEKMVRNAIEALGQLDYLINNAGTSNTLEPIPPADMNKLTEEFWAQILTTNLIGPFRCTHAAADALKAARGAVCNTASVAGINMPGSSMAYGASKAGLISLTKNLARALAPEARVNAVAPGFVDTEWTKPWPAECKQASIERTLLKRACRPQDIAAAIVFLCADTDMVTAQTLVVDGGLM
jgi:3-oxoacyl-[acyl-carrier protein] reductase